jgi:hypothetical protein
LTEAIGELLRDQAPDDVGGATGRKRNDDSNGLVRPGLRVGLVRGTCE